MIRTMSSPKDDLLRAIELNRIAGANIVGYDDSQLMIRLHRSEADADLDTLRVALTLIFLRLQKLASAYWERHVHGALADDYSQRSALRTDHIALSEISAADLADDRRRDLGVTDIDFAVRRFASSIMIAPFACSSSATAWSRATIVPGAFASSSSARLRWSPARVSAALARSKEPAVSSTSASNGPFSIR
jgi:hypothetical protein